MYNLLDEKWIPVLRTDGKADRVGIRDSLIQAGSIRQIAASNPMDNVALLRLLLAVLQWCKPDVTPDRKRTLQNGKQVGIPAEWLNEKLGTEPPNPSFDLLSGSGGFYQDASLLKDGAGGKPVAVTNLLHDLPSGSKIAHFRHTKDEADGLCFSCCALGLIRWSTVASAGTAGAGQSMTASINGNTPTYAFCHGPTLLATLALNLPVGQSVSGDKPVWDGATETSALGTLKGLTWRSRSAILAPPNPSGQRALSSGFCCYCGEQTNRLVKTALFRPGWERPSKEPWPKDPHLLGVTRNIGKSGEKLVVPDAAGPNDPIEINSATWRSVAEGLLQRAVGSGNGLLVFETTMVASSQALYKDAVTFSTSLPALELGVAQTALQELKWLKGFTWITVAGRTDKNSWKDPPKGHWVVDALRDSDDPKATAHAFRSVLSSISVTTERELETAFVALVRHLAAADSGATERWRAEVKRIATGTVKRAVMASVSGSPLKRRNSVRCAVQALNRALDYHDETAGTKATNPNRKKRGDE